MPCVSWATLLCRTAGPSGQPSPTMGRLEVKSPFKRETPTRIAHVYFLQPHTSEATKQREKK